MESQEEAPEALSVKMTDGIADAQLEGELSIQTIDTLKDPIFSLLNAHTIRLDLTKVTDIDSCGLQLLIILYQQAGLLNRQFTLVGQHSRLDQLLAVYQLTLPQAAFAETAP